MYINNIKLIQYLKENNVQTIQITLNIRKNYNKNKKTQPLKAEYLIKSLIDTFNVYLDLKTRTLMFIYKHERVIFGQESFFTNDEQLQSFIKDEMKEAIIERL